MSIVVEKFSPREWEQFSETAHRICFKEHKPSEWDRIDFALMVKNNSRLLGYLTCREIDAETLYWQFGGAFPQTKDTATSFKGYEAFVAYCKPLYKRVTTLIENTNTVMLKMAMKVGFRIVGIRFFKGTILLEHLLEFNHAS